MADSARKKKEQRVSAPPGGALATLREITPQVLAERRFALLEARIKERTLELDKARQRLRLMNRNLMRMQDEERRRLALELHDGAGQLLVALKWKLDSLQQVAAGRELPEIGKLANDSLRLLDELSHELRSVSHLLHPPPFDKAGFPSALRVYVEGLKERSGLFVHLEIDSSLQKLPPELEATVFRIVQEALTNVRRHAKTSTANVRISHSSYALEIRIEDRGQGIPSFTSLDAPNLKLGVGIQGMRERVRRLKGQFEIASGKGGTTLTAVLPIDWSTDIHSRERCVA